MANHYKSIFFFLLFQSYLKVYSINSKDNQSYILINDISSKNILHKKHQKEKNSTILNEKPPMDDIFEEYKLLLEKDEELQKTYIKHYLEFEEKNNQLKIDRIHICLLILVVCFLSGFIFIYACYELYKFIKNKSISKAQAKPISNIYSLSKDINLLEQKSTESTKSNEESFKKNSSNNPSQIGDLNDSSNFNIFIQSNDNKDKKEKEIILNYLDKGEEAPIQFKEKSNNNIINNVFNDDIKTLTNDEDVYFASKTDKILYKPYSEEEINNK